MIILVLKFNYNIFILYKMFQKLFSLFSSSKRRKYKGTKRNKYYTKRRTRRVYPKGMRGGWGQPMDTLPEMFKKGGVTKDGIMKGGWGGPVTLP